MQRERTDRWPEEAPGTRAVGNELSRTVRAAAKTPPAKKARHTRFKPTAGSGWPSSKTARRRWVRNKLTPTKNGRVSGPNLFSPTRQDRYRAYR